MKILGFVNFVIVDKVEYGGSVWLVELWPVSKKNRKKVLKKYFFGTFCSKTLKPDFSRTVLGTTIIYASIDRANCPYQSAILSERSITWFLRLRKIIFFGFLIITSESQ